MERHFENTPTAGRAGGDENFRERLFSLQDEFNASMGDNWMMVSPGEETSDLVEDEPGVGGEGIPIRMGSRRILAPPLGEVTWKLPEESAVAVWLSAYSCESPHGTRIGYVRVPHYGAGEHRAEAFEEIIARLEDTTAVLVLDQMNNPGGSMYQMYAMLSALTDRPLVPPQHQLKIWDEDAAKAAEVVDLADHAYALAPEERPSPELVSYSRFILAEMAAGRGVGGSLTDRTFLGGVAEIQPGRHPYTKPIFVLINELTFSAGEFLAAILQDHRKGTLVGVRTAGAGGCARPTTFRGKFIELPMTLAWTIARRANGDYIENYGVHPDIPLAASVDDIRFEYAPFRDALLEIVDP
jgi:Peptidase family S41